MAGNDKNVDLRRLFSRTAKSTLLQSRVVCSYLGDDKKMVGDESAFFYDNVEHNTLIVRGYYIEDILSASWFLNMRSEI